MPGTACTGAGARRARCRVRARMVVLSDRERTMPVVRGARHRVILRAGATCLPAWLSEHPHAAPRRMAKSTNTLYIAAEHLGGRPECPSAGALRFNARLMLTKPGLPRSRWDLDPALFRHLSISYHSALSWRDGYFQSYLRAQEYVVHADEPVIDWAHDLICSSARWS